MIITFDLYTLLMSAGIVLFAMVLGYWKGMRDTEESSIQKTINYLIHEGFVKWKHNKDGEVELLPLDNND